MKLLKTFTLLIMLSFFGIAQSQTVNISGMVTNLETGINLSNHQIQVFIPNVADSIFIYTNEEGFFLHTIELNEDDSSLAMLSTIDPCSGNWLYEEIYSGQEEVFIQFNVCESIIEPDSCIASFDYFVETYYDSLLFDQDTMIEVHKVNFIDMSVGQIENWYWNFGDGTTSTEQNPIYEYTTNGSYNVSLTISGPACENTYETTIALSDTIWEPCYAEFYYEYAYSQDSANQDSLANDTLPGLVNTVHFYDYSGGNPTQWFWEFGDGFSSIEQNPEHTYNTDGHYTVTLHIQSENCNTAISKNITIGNPYEECNSYFTYSYLNLNDSTGYDSTFLPDPSSMDLSTIQFHNQSTGSIYEYFWDFGDGNISHDYAPIHTYEFSGDYLVSLQVFGENCHSYFDQYVYVSVEPEDTNYEHECYAMFYPVNKKGNKVKFINESYGEISTYTWEFGDGNSSSKKNPLHTYAEPGEYIVTLTIASDSLCYSTIDMSIWAGDYDTDSTLVALFLPEINGTEVTFINQSQGDVWNYHWDFGDGTTDNTANPTHFYSEIGKYIVTLGIGNNVDVNTFTMEIDLENDTYKGFFDNKNATDINDNTIQISELKAFPNPVGELTNIGFTSDESTLGELTIYNITGAVVLNKTVDINNGKNKVELNTSTLNSGIYFLQLNTANNKSQTLKITK